MLDVHTRNFLCINQLKCTNMSSNTKVDDSMNSRIALSTIHFPNHSVLAVDSGSSQTETCGL